MDLLASQQVLDLISSIDIPDRPIVPLWLWDARGYVLASEVRANCDIPSFNRSAMDGYAVRSADVKTVPCELKVVAVREAGDNTTVAIEAGQCVKIMTGAAVPDSADSVVMIENTESDEPVRRVTIVKSVGPGENIAKRGEDAAAGSIVLKAGQLLTGQALSVAAGVGETMLKVYQQPYVSLLQTGGELVEPGGVTDQNSIYNSNATLLAGVIKDTQIGHARYLGISRDDKRQLSAMVANGLKDDVLILTGGVSTGDFDYVPEILRESGVDIHVHGAEIKPGKPLLFGSAPGGKFVFGLPGNPVSVMVCFYEYVLPFLRRLAGFKGVTTLADVQATLTKTVQKKLGRQFNCPAFLFYQDGQLMANPIPGHGSGDYVATADVNGMIIITAQVKQAEKGQQVTARLWQVPGEGKNSNTLAV